MMLETEENDEKDTIWKLECNIDDCTGETLGYCMGKLLQAGARDVHYIPVYMKKNRPAYQLDVICEEEKRETLENIIFTETTTIGIRRCQMERTVMKRDLQRSRPNTGMRCQDLPSWGDRKSLPGVRECRTHC